MSLFNRPHCQVITNVSCFSCHHLALFLFFQNWIDIEWKWWWAVWTTHHFPTELSTCWHEQGRWRWWWQSCPIFNQSMEVHMSLKKGTTRIEFRWQTFSFTVMLRSFSLWMCYAFGNGQKWWNSDLFKVHYWMLIKYFLFSVGIHILNHFHVKKQSKLKWHLEK